MQSVPHASASISLLHFASLRLSVHFLSLPLPNPHLAALPSSHCLSPSHCPRPIQRPSLIPLPSPIQRPSPHPLPSPIQRPSLILPFLFLSPPLCALPLTTINIPLSIS